MKLIRWILGRFILLLNWLTMPKRPDHSPQVQQKLDEQTQELALYQYQACPFCVKTRRAVRRLGLNIELRDAKNDLKHRADLELNGGKVQVPCLLIGKNSNNPEWLYESSDINDYLQKRFAQ